MKDETIETYKQRLKIPLDGSDALDFFTDYKTIMAMGYSRIVIGGRGPYIEFEDKHIMHINIFVPEDQKYRLNASLVYYDEYRSKDEANVKLYLQKKTVDYADYIVGKWYISPFDLNVNGRKIIEKLKRTSKIK